MTDPKNAEAQNEELDLEELKGAAGGYSVGGGNIPIGTKSKSSAKSFTLKQHNNYFVNNSAPPGGSD